MSQQNPTPWTKHRMFGSELFKLCDASDAIVTVYLSQEDASKILAKVNGQAELIQELVAATNKLAGILDIDPYGCHVCGAKRPVDWDDDSGEPLKHLPGCDLEAARLVVEKAKQ